MGLPDRETLLGWLAERAEDRSAGRDVAAIKLLLEELRRDADDDEGEGSQLERLDGVVPFRRPAA